MYAIVDIAGQQFKVEKGKRIFVHRLDTEEGKEVSFDKVLLIDNDGKILVGEPHIKGAYIQGKVIEHTKGDKVIVFKKKRRKGYKVKNGHRQQFSHIEINAINEKGFTKKPAGAAAKKEEKPVSKEAGTPGKAKAEAKTTASTSKAKPKTETKASAPKAKSSATKKTAADSDAAKSTTAKKTTAKAAGEKKASGTKSSTSTSKTAATKKPAAKKSTTASKQGTAKTAQKKSSPAAKKTTASKAKPKSDPKGAAEKKDDK